MRDLILNLTQDLNKLVNDINAPGAFPKAFWPTARELSKEANKLVMLYNGSDDYEEDTTINIMQADLWLYKGSSMLFSGDHTGALKALNEALLYLGDIKELCSR